jgi:PAS domain S-box-containing protein
LGVRDVLSILGAGVVLVALGATSLHSYLLFHGLAEIFSVVVASGIFMIVWNSRQIVDNAYLKFLGIAYLFVALVDALHLLAYRGMGVFTWGNGDLGIQLWIIGRSLQASALLIAPMVMGRSFRSRYVFAGYAVVTGVLLAATFHWRVFPACYADGALTPFKKAAEAGICVALVFALVLLIRHRREFDRSVVQMVAMSICATILSEMAFMFYARVDDPVNMLGHLLKIVAYYLIYKAMIEIALVRPYDLLFRDLKKSEGALRESSLRFRMIVDESPGGIVVVGRDGLVQYANPAAQAMLGSNATELLGGPFPYPIEPGKSAAFRMPRANGEGVDTRVRVVNTIWEGMPALLVCMHDV